MFHFAIIDDDKNVLSTVKRILFNYQKQKDFLQIELKPYQFSDLFLKSYKKGDFDLIFLDIDMPSITGVELAQKIRLIDKKVFFVFVTGHNQFIYDAMKIHSFEYIIKPIEEKRLSQVIDDYFLQMHELEHKASPVLVYSNKSNNISIETDSILFIEHYHNVSEITMKHQKTEIYATLKKILPKLPNNFAMCHKSCIVNMNAIVQRNKNDCIMTNGEVIPIGRTKKVEFRGLYMNFLNNAAKNHFEFKDEEG